MIELDDSVKSEILLYPKQLNIIESVQNIMATDIWRQLNREGGFSVNVNLREIIRDEFRR